MGGNGDVSTSGSRLTSACKLDRSAAQSGATWRPLVRSAPSAARSITSECSPGSADRPRIGPLDRNGGALARPTVDGQPHAEIPRAFVHHADAQVAGLNIGRVKALSVVADDYANAGLGPV